MTTKPTTKPKTCVLCGKRFTEWGNNPEPLAPFASGQCCNECDDLKVIPARLKAMGVDEKTSGEIAVQLHGMRAR